MQSVEEHLHEALCLGAHRVHSVHAEILLVQQFHRAPHLAGGGDQTLFRRRDVGTDGLHLRRLNAGRAIQGLKHGQHPGGVAFPFDGGKLLPHDAQCCSHMGRLLTDNVLGLQTHE